MSGSSLRSSTRIGFLGGTRCPALLLRRQLGCELVVNELSQADTSCGGHLLLERSSSSISSNSFTPIPSNMPDFMTVLRMLFNNSCTNSASSCSAAQRNRASGSVVGGGTSWSTPDEGTGCAPAVARRNASSWKVEYCIPTLPAPEGTVNSSFARVPP